MTTFVCVLIGLVGGVFSGAFGIGGGVIMVPALVYFLGLTQHQAQGTTLTVFLIPVGLLAVMRYYQSGNVKVHMAILIAAGFILGAVLGANVIHGISDAALKRIFGIVMVLIGLNMFLLK